MRRVTPDEYEDSTIYHITQTVRDCLQRTPTTYTKKEVDALCKLVAEVAIAGYRAGVSAQMATQKEDKTQKNPAGA